MMETAGEGGRSMVMAWTGGGRMAAASPAAPLCAALFLLLAPPF